MSESERDAWNAGFAEAVRRHCTGTLHESRDPGNPFAPSRDGVCVCSTPGHTHAVSLHSNEKCVTLIQFVQARLEDDRPFAEFGCSGTGEYSLCAEMSERFKADWNAKRRIVEFYQEAVAEGYDTSQAEDAACAIAATWAGHPDFREWWRP